MQTMCFLVIWFRPNRCAASSLVPICTLSMLQRLIVRAQLTQGETLELSGPGIEQSRLLQIGGLPGGFWQLRRSLIRYPMGFDLLLVDGDCLVGIPRSTCVETA